MLQSLFSKDTAPTYDLRRPTEAKKYLKEAKDFELRKADIPPVIRLYPPHWSPFIAGQYSIINSKLEPENRKNNIRRNIADLKRSIDEKPRGVKSSEEAKNIGIYLTHLQNLTEDVGRDIAKISDEINGSIENKRKQLKKLKSSGKLNLSVSFGSGATTLGLGILSGLAELELQTGVNVGVAILGLSSIGVTLKSFDGIAYVADKAVSYQTNKLKNKLEMRENKIYEGLLSDVAGTFDECLPYYVKRHKEKKHKSESEPKLEIIVIPPSEIKVQV